MNPFFFALRRQITTLMLVAGMTSGGVLALKKGGVAIPAALNSSKIDLVLGYLGMGGERKEPSEPHAEAHEAHEEGHKIVVTSPEAKDVILTQPYVCQIHSRQHIEVRALAKGFLQKIRVQEGQRVKKGDVMFEILPVLYQARLDAENAEAKLAQLKYNNTRRLAESNLHVVSQNEVPLFEAEWAKARAKAQLAGAELGFTRVTAPFDGIVDRQQQQSGSLVEEGHILTTLSDNSTMWVYFNVPEADYLRFMADATRDRGDQKIELVLANGDKFPQTAASLTIEAKFNNETGNISFRADFPNKEGLLRHGQTGTVLIKRVAKGAVVIPQRAVFEVLDKRFVYVVDKDDVVHQREIGVEKELDDIYLIHAGVKLTDRIVLEGIRQVRDGEKVRYEFLRPEAVTASLKNQAE